MTKNPSVSTANGHRTRRLVVFVLVVMLAGYVYLAWQNWGLSSQGTVTQGMVRTIVEKAKTDTIKEVTDSREKRIEPIEAEAKKAKTRADKAEQKANTISNKQRHVERVVKPLLPLAERPAVVEKIVEEHVQQAVTPTPVLTIPAEPTRKDGLLNLLFGH